MRCGGVLQNHEGCWKMGFTMKLDQMDGLSTEVWSILISLEIAWDKGLIKVIVESDSKVTVGLVCDGCASEHSLAPVVHRIRQKMERNWEVRIAHCCREGNAAANWLATTTLESNMNLQLLKAPSDGITPILLRDKMKIGILRWSSAPD